MTSRTDDQITITLSETDYVELLGALELAHAAAGLVPGGDGTARQQTIAAVLATAEAAGR